MNYVLMMPVLNEREHVIPVVESVLKQIIKPIMFIIIDGGSTDNTFETLLDYSEKYSWILAINQTNFKGESGHKKISCAMVEAYDLMQELPFKSVTYIGHIDADFKLEPDTFQKMIVEMESDPTLGVIGGVLYTDGKPEVYPKDEIPNIRLYRKEALDQIGGYPYSRYSWDSVILAKLRMAGWKIKTCEKAKIINMRSGELSQKNLWVTAKSFGEARYYLGYSLPLFLAGTVYATKNNGIVFGIALLVGYFSSLGKPKTKDEQILNYYQHERLKEVLGK